jgi:hypothetical protein
VYGIRPLTKNITLDTYYLGLDRKAATFNRGVGQEVRHSIGARLSRPVAQTKPGWDFDYEALWQFGSFGSANIRAWTVASETGYRLPTVPLKPRFSAKADISSGDDPRTNTLGTFADLSQYVLEVLRRDEEFVLYRGEHSNQRSPSVLLLVPASMQPADGDRKKDRARVLVKG